MPFLNIIELSGRRKLYFSHGVAYLDLLRASSSGSCTVEKMFQVKKEKKGNWFYAILNPLEAYQKPN